MVQEKKMPETKKDIKKNDKETNKENDEMKDEDIKAAVKGKNSSIKNDKQTEKNSMLFYILTIFTALLLVVLIIGGAFFFAIKNNVNGIAESMRGTIENIPILSLALPEKPDPEDEKNMTEEEVRKKYTQLKNNKDALEKQVSDLTNQLEQLNKQLSAKDTNSALAQQQKDTLEKEKLALTTENASLKKDLDDLSAAIANGDTAEFKK